MDKNINLEIRSLMSKKKSYNNYEINKLLNDLHEFYSIPMKMMIGDAHCFSQKEFKKHYGKIMILSCLRRNLEDFLKIQKEE